jgi:hypothetical protein
MLRELALDPPRVAQRVRDLGGKADDGVGAAPVEGLDDRVEGDEAVQGVRLRPARAGRAGP